MSKVRLKASLNPLLLFIADYKVFCVLCVVVVWFCQKWANCHNQPMREQHLISNDQLQVMKFRSSLLIWLHLICHSEWNDFKQNVELVKVESRSWISNRNLKFISLLFFQGKGFLLFRIITFIHLAIYEGLREAIQKKENI